MTNKMTFSVEDVKLLDENVNSSFSTLSMDFFASGANRHDTYVSEETLMRTAGTIKNCPVVWMYDPVTDDAYTHNKNEIACGFIPESAEIKSRVLPDGRTMLNVAARVWKKFSGDILEFFKRDGNNKPISVEMSVTNTKVMPNNLLELLDYTFEAVTILGTFITPAIPLAQATVIQFAKEYKEDYMREFSDKYDSVDFTIPRKVKSNAQAGLDLHKEHKRGGVSTNLAFAKWLIKNEKATPEKIRSAYKYFMKHKSEDFSDKTSGTWISHQLMGGNEMRKWSATLVEQLNSIDDTRVSYFSDIADETKPILEIENLENKGKEEVSMADEKIKEEEKVESPAEEKAESPEKEKEEVAKGEEKKFSLAGVDFEAFASSLAGEDEDEMVGMAVEELKKGAEFADPGVILKGAYAKMCKMSAKFAQAEEEKKVWMAENEELKKFKADTEAKQKAFAVDATLQELAEKVVIPEDALVEMKAKADEFAFSEIEGWKNYCKAKSFDFAVKTVKGKEEDIVRIGFPFAGTVKSSKDNLWA